MLEENIESLPQYSITLATVLRTIRISSGLVFKFPYHTLGILPYHVVLSSQYE